MLLSLPSLPSVGGTPRVGSVVFPRRAVLSPAPLNASKPGARRNFLSPSRDADNGGQSDAPVTELPPLKGAGTFTGSSRSLLKIRKVTPPERGGAFRSLPAPAAPLRLVNRLAGDGLHPSSLQGTRYASASVFSSSLLSFSPVYQLAVSLAPSPSCFPACLYFRTDFPGRLKNFLERQFGAS